MQGVRGSLDSSKQAVAMHINFWARRGGLSAACYDLGCEGH